jgi:hypothetical protein
MIRFFRRKIGQPDFALAQSSSVRVDGSSGSHEQFGPADELCFSQFPSS